MDSSLIAETHFLFSKGSAPVVTPKKDEGGGRGMEVRGRGEEVGSRGIEVGGRGREVES